MKNIIIRIGVVIAILILLSLQIVLMLPETIYYAVRWIATGKPYPEQPIFIKIIINLTKFVP